MNHTKAIKAVMVETGAKQTDLMKQLGMKSRSSISGRINQENISVKALLEILDAMGYELVVKKPSKEYKHGEYPIRLSDYEK